MGTDAAGRRQYRYHDLWREQRDQDKHDRVAHFGAALPAIREAIGRDLDTRGLSRERVLAAAVRLIELGFFRPGGEEYAEQNGTFGLATIRKDHVTLTKGQLVFEYPAKGAKDREQAVAEDGPTIAATLGDWERTPTSVTSPPGARRKRLSWTCWPRPKVGRQA
jgi:DNA topoisomerase IB